MCNGPNTTAENVEICDSRRAENPERIQSLRRQVDVTACIKRRRRDEKHRLRLHKLPQRFVDLRISLRHRYPWILRTSSARGTETCSPVARFFSANESAFTSFSPRSEERRVGKECRSR